MKRVLLILSLLLCGQLTSAQSWTKVAQKDGGSVASLVSNKYGDLYCAALNQVYRSIDQGTSWQKLKNPVDSLSSVQLFPSCDSNGISSLFVLTGGRVLRTTDEGSSWFNVAPLNDSISRGSLVNLFASRYGDLLISLRTSSGFSLMRSRDNANTFEFLANLDASPTSVYQSQDSTYYVFTSSGYRINKDHSSTSIGNLRITGSSQLSFNGPVSLWAIQNNAPFVSSNKGDLWKSALNNFKELSGGSITKIVTGRDAEAYVFWRAANDSMRVYRLYSGSTSWAKIREMKYSFKDILVNSNGSMVASSTYGIYSSEEGAQSWINTSKGISTYPLVCAAMSQNAVCVAGDNGIVSQSNTGGLSWSTSNVPDSDGVNIFQDMISTAKGHLVVATRNGVWVSTDLGLNYINGRYNGNALNQTAYSLAEVAPGVLYASTDAGLYRSNDDGLNWSVVDSLLRSPSIFSLGNGRFLVSKSDGVYSGDTASSALVVSASTWPLGKVASNIAGDVMLVSSVNVGSTFGVKLYRKKGSGSTEIIDIPSTGKQTDIISWVVSGKNGDVYVNTDLGLYYVNASSTNADRSNVESEIFTFLRNVNATAALGTTLYGGVYMHDLTLDVPLEAEAPAEIQVSPSPSVDYCFVQTNEDVESYELRTLTGQLVSSIDLSTPTQQLFIDTKSFMSGSYILSLRASSLKILRSKIVIVK